MWSLGATHRNWHPHLGGRSHQLLQLVITTSRISSINNTSAGSAAQCHSRVQSSFYSSLTSSPPSNPLTKMDKKRPTEYGRWTKDALIKRIQALERKLVDADVPLHSEPESSPAEETETASKKKKKKGVVDPAKYSTRLVALKLAYLGKNYGGFEYQASGKLPSIEEELWKALVKGCLIFPENPDEVNFDPWEYSKCGRTDRGVSAFGQVIAIRLRSRRPLSGTEEKEGEKPEFNDLLDELPYARLLNRLLPPDIRILAWCPTTPADFSARHHCRERQYRYFFTQPAYAPLPTSYEDPKARRTPKDGWLDIEAMRDAAKRYEGVHDFRNFCRIDGSKSQQNFERRIFASEIVEVEDVETALPYLHGADFLPSPSPSSPSSSTEVGEKKTFPKVYYFHVRGSAFLWHQIRCMVAVLFAVAQGLEDPSVVDKLLDVEAEPRRPAYVLANETPLVLWNCLFPKDLDDPTRQDGMEWVYVGEDVVPNAHGPSGLVDHMWEIWRERKMDELLAAQLLGIVATQGDITRRLSQPSQLYAPISHRVFEGGNRDRSVGTYVPLLKKDRLATPQETYDKDARKRGFESAAHKEEVYARQKAEAEAAAAAAAQEAGDA